MAGMRETPAGAISKVELEKKPEAPSDLKQALDSRTKRQYEEKFLEKLKKEEPELHKNLSEMMKDPDNQEYKKLTDALKNLDEFIEIKRVAEDPKSNEAKARFTANMKKMDARIPKDPGFYAWMLEKHPEFAKQVLDLKSNQTIGGIDATMEKYTKEFNVPRDEKLVEFAQRLETFGQHVEGDKVGFNYPKDFYIYLYETHREFVNKALGLTYYDSTNPATAQENVNQVRVYFKEYNKAAAATDNVTKDGKSADTVSKREPRENVKSALVTPEGKREPPKDGTTFVAHEDHGTAEGATTGHTEHSEPAADNNDMTVHDKDFTVKLDAAHDRTVRIEQLVDHAKVPALKSDKFGDKTFYYDESLNSYYNGDQRLVIHSGDKIAVAKDERGKEEKEKADLAGEFKLRESEDGSYRITNAKGKEKWEFDSGNLKIFASMKNITKIESGFAADKKYYTYDAEQKTFVDSEGKKLVFDQDHSAFHTLKSDVAKTEQKTAEKPGEKAEQHELTQEESLQVMNKLVRLSFGLSYNNKRDFTKKIERNLHKKYDKDFGKDFVFIFKDFVFDRGVAKIIFSIEGNGKKQTFEFKGEAGEVSGVDKNKTYAIKNKMDYYKYALDTGEIGRAALKNLFRGDFFNGIFEKIDQGDISDSKEK